jgi:hypothetical protein
MTKLSGVAAFTLTGWFVPSSSLDWASAAARPDVSLLPSAHRWQLPLDALELALPNVPADVVSASAAMAKKSLSRYGFARCES